MSPPTDVSGHLRCGPISRYLPAGRRSKGWFDAVARSVPPRQLDPRAGRRRFEPPGKVLLGGTPECLGFGHVEDLPRGLAPACSGVHGYSRTGERTCALPPQRTVTGCFRPAFSGSCILSACWVCQCYSWRSSKLSMQLERARGFEPPTPTLARAGVKGN